MTMRHDLAGREIRDDKRQYSKPTVAEQLTDAVQALGVEDVAAAFREMTERRQGGN